MRTEEEVKKELVELGDKFDLIKGDEKEVWQYWEEERKLQDELKAIQEAKRLEEYNSPEAIAERKRKWEEQQLKNITESGIGKRYLSVDINSFICETPDQEKILDTVKQFISNPYGKNLWLVGVAGTGKTLLGAIICRYLGAKYIKS